MSSSSVVRVNPTLCAFVSITGALQIISYEGSAFAKCAEARNEQEGLNHLAAANQAYQNDLPELALREYQAAYGLCRSAMVFFGMASCEAELGRDTDAARDFERFLREGPNDEADLRREAADKLRSLSARLTVVDLVGEVDRATVLVDQQAVNGWAKGTPLFLSPGLHTLRVEGGAVGMVERVLTGERGVRLRLLIPRVEARDDARARSLAKPSRRWWLWGGIATALVAGAVAGYVVSRPDRPACLTICP